MNGRNPGQLTFPQLKLWLQCRGAVTMIWYPPLIWYPHSNFSQFTYKILLLDCQNTAWCVSAHFNAIIYLPYQGSYIIVVHIRNCSNTPRLARKALFVLGIRWTVATRGCTVTKCFLLHLYLALWILHRLF